MRCNKASWELGWDEQKSVRCGKTEVGARQSEQQREQDTGVNKKYQTSWGNFKKLGIVGTYCVRKRK